MSSIDGLGSSSSLLALMKGDWWSSFFKKDLEVSGTIAEGGQTVEGILHLTVEIRGVDKRGRW